MKTKQQLTEKQQQAVDFFTNHKRIFGRYPTFAEVGAALHIAPAVVRSRIILAEKKGENIGRYKVTK